MRKKELRTHAISVEKFLKNYCFLMPYTELLDLEMQAYNLLDMYRIVDSETFNNLCKINIKTLRIQLRNLGIKTRGANFDNVKVGDILVGDVIVVSDRFGNIFAFDWSMYNIVFDNEFCKEKQKILKRSGKNDKHKRK